MNAEDIKKTLLNHFPKKEIRVTPGYTLNDGAFEIQVVDMIFNGKNWDTVGVRVFYDPWGPQSISANPLSKQILYIEDFFKHYE